MQMFGGASFYRKMAGPSISISPRALLMLWTCVVFSVTSWTQSDTHQARNSAKSGIEGVVLLGPGCPGPARLDRPCPDSPYKAELLIQRESDHKTVARTESGANGRFRVALAPGRYFIVNAPGPKYPAIHSPGIKVRRNRFTRVEIHADTGMR